MTWIVLSLVLALAAGLAAYFLHARRRSRAKAAAKAAPGPRYWGKQLVVPDPARACQAAKVLNGQIFAFHRVPPLPLKGCTNAECKCGFEPVQDRRSGKERRSGVERREQIRFEDRKDRRGGRDRRSGDHYDWDFTA